MGLYAGGMDGSVVHDPMLARASKVQFPFGDRDRQVLVNVGETVVQVAFDEIFDRNGVPIGDAIGIAPMYRTRREHQTFGLTKPWMPAQLSRHVHVGPKRETKFEPIGVQNDVVEHRTGERPWIHE